MTRASTPFNRDVVGPSAGVLGRHSPDSPPTEWHCLVFGRPWQQAPPATDTIGQRDPWVARLAALQSAWVLLLPKHLGQSGVGCPPRPAPSSLHYGVLRY